MNDHATVSALKGGARLAVGVDHPNYSVNVNEINPAVRDSLTGDLQA